MFQTLVRSEQIYVIETTDLKETMLLLIQEFNLLHEIWSHLFLNLM